MKLGKKFSAYSKWITASLLAAVAVSVMPLGNAIDPADWVLADLQSLELLNLSPIASDASIGVGLVRVNSFEKNRLSELNHEAGRCGGYEIVNGEVTNKSDAALVIKGLVEQVARQNVFRKREEVKVAYQVEIFDAVKTVKADQIREFIKEYSSFPTRFHKSANPNSPVEWIKNKIENMIADAGAESFAKVVFVAHSDTPQNSLNLRLEGRKTPSEVVVAGGHLDSITQSLFNKKAPGADDNASGTAALLEMAKIVLRKGQPERSVEFYWYAAEEVGLVGSSNIAKQAKRDGKDVIAALQLDMLAFPGSGKKIFGLITDFTHAGLRAYFVKLNDTYVKTTIIDSKCGYACSDHASWFRQGYPVVFPIEARFDDSNRAIHSDKDILDARLDTEHAAALAEIGVSYILDLANRPERF